VTFSSPAGLEEQVKHLNGEKKVVNLYDTERTRPDLMRIKGIGVEYAKMLEAVGVPSVLELSLCDPRTLSDALLEVNLLREMVRAVPSEKRVAGWVRQAQSLRMGH
jgi:hypothetical protein